MYKLPRIRLRVVREGSVASDTRTVAGPADAARIARALIGDTDREHVVALLLDIRHRVIGVHVVGVGTLTSCTVHPRELFKCAIVSNAAAVVIAHNHPSGDSRPSPTDRDLTDRITAAGRLLGIGVLDHVIIGETDFTSIRQIGGGESPWRDA